jgi:hypothetical protein
MWFGMRVQAKRLYKNKAGNPVYDVDKTVGLLAPHARPWSCLAECPLGLHGHLPPISPDSRVLEH